MVRTSNHIIERFFEDEERFLAKANDIELAHLVEYFHERTRLSVSEAEHDFYSDRLQQMGVRGPVLGMLHAMESR